jgi:acyl dehydratase
VLSKKESSDPSRGVVVFRDHVLNQRDEVVFELDKITLIRRRPAGA